VTASYIGRRLGAAAITILLIVLVNFLLFRAMPGSPERFQRNPHVTPALLEAQRIRWGLDKPVIPDQLIAYVGASLRGDLGYSYVARGRTVVEVLGERFWPTLLLFGLGEVIAIIGGLALGAYSGWRRGGPVDHIGNGLSLLLYSTPYFLLGMALLLIFATWLGWFPTFGMVTAGATFASPVERLIDVGRHLVLPVATVALGLIGQYAIVMRSSIVETMSEEYVTTARAKGLSDGRILRHHALPNALLPTVTLVAINLGYVVAGAITVEVVFNWPGLGTLTVEALSARDYPVLQGIFLLLSVSVVLANLAADLLYGRLDPRVRT
jgi:peptide/nickel transport system permease protein